MSIITISRGTFSGGEKLAECLAKKLGYKSISREILVQAAEKYGISENQLITAMEAKPALTERLSLNIDRFRYLSFIQATLCEQAKNDNVVYYGHAGHLLLKNACPVIKVKVIASMEQRILFAMEHNKISREEAISYIKKMDKYRKQWTKFLYDIDWKDPSLYDIIINLKDTSIQTACDMIAVMTTAPEFQLTEASKKALADLTLESQVKAMLASDDTTKDYLLKITVQDGNVRVSGRVRNAEDANRIKTIIEEMPGVKSMDCSCVNYYINDDVIL
jgi:cytidylate kinase